MKLPSLYKHRKIEQNYFFGDRDKMFKKKKIKVIDLSKKIL